MDNEKNYIVTQCATCGILNLIPKEFLDRCVCTQCSGRILNYIGYAVINEDYWIK